MSRTRRTRPRPSYATEQAIRGRQPCGKVGYETRKLARLALKKTQSGSKGSGIRAYKCPSCGWWHNGHIAPAVLAGETTARELYG